MSAAVLVPKLLAAGYRVTVLDLYLYGDDVLKASRGNPGLREVKGDIRDAEVVKQALDGCDAVIHLACISNDPSFELDPDLGQVDQLDASVPLVRAAKAPASSASSTPRRLASTASRRASR